MSNAFGPGILDIGIRNSSVLNIYWLVNVTVMQSLNQGCKPRITPELTNN